jgi:sarcosine oxidase, subunit beta
MSSGKIVVVGGGVIGSSIAWHLARKGVDVTVVEARSVAAAASGASAGGVRQQGRGPREMPLAIAANSRWKTLPEELLADIHYYREGHIKVYEREDDLPIALQSAKDQQALGLSIDVVEGKELHDLVPGLAPHIVAGTYTSGDGHANPTLTTRAFAAAAAREGAHSIIGEHVRGFSTSGNRVTGVITDRQELSADHVILATGAWTRDLVLPLGIDVPIVPIGLQMVLTKPGPSLLRQVVGAYQRPLSLKQLRDGNYLIGGGYPGDVDMDSGVGRVQAPNVAASRKTASAIFPILNEIGIERSWVGVEGIAVDEIPVIGHLPAREGITVAAGFSGHGFALSPIVGQLVSELVVDGHPSISLDAFTADRFAGMDQSAPLTASAG